MEAIAKDFRLDPYCGRASARTGRPHPTTTPLGEVLKLETTAAGARMLAGPRLKKKGFFLRAETSFTACLHLVALMHQLGRSGSQVVCATHSPILASTPGADIIEVGDHGYQRTTWGELELVDHWRRYLEHPDAYLRHLTDDQGHQEEQRHASG